MLKQSENQSYLLNYLDDFWFRGCTFLGQDQHCALDGTYKENNML
jgi:hypothetical protein